jgi:hypothetical protein
MSTQTKDGQLVTTAEQVHVGADTTTQPAQDLIDQLVRQGLDISLKSLQVWADLTRQLGPTALRSPVGAAMVFLAYDLFEKVLMAQRQVVDELVATQRQFAQHFLKNTATVGGDLARR